jgi:hypothetical protein
MEIDYKYTYHSSVKHFFFAGFWLVTPYGHAPTFWVNISPSTCYTDDRGDTLIRNVGNNIEDYTLSQARRPKSTF